MAKTKTKDELLKEARALGVTGLTKETTNADIQSAIDKATAAKGDDGPPAGGDQPPAPTSPTPRSTDGEVSDNEDLPTPPPTDRPADTADTPQHPASIVEPLPVDERPGPGSIMSREIRPDEQDLPPGTSALQRPPEG